MARCAIALGVCDYFAESIGCPGQLLKMPLEGSIIPVVEGMFREGAANHAMAPDADPGLVGDSCRYTRSVGFERRFP